MKPKAWYNFLNEERSAFEEKGCVFGVSGTDFFLLTVRGRNNQEEIRKTAESIQNGQLLSSFAESDIDLLPIERVDRIEVKEYGKVVDVKSELSGRKNMRWPISKDQPQGEDVAREIATTTGRSFEESRRDVGFGAAIAKPVMAGLLAIMLAICLFVVSFQAESGEEVAFQGTRSAGKAIALMISTTLGVKGSLIVGALAISAALAFGIHNLINRPQFTVFEFDWRKNNYSS